MHENVLANQVYPVSQTCLSLREKIPVAHLRKVIVHRQSKRKESQVLARFRTVVGAALATLVVTAGYARGAQPVIVGGEVPVARRVAVSQIEHSDWNGLLQKYVDTSGMVDYAAWKQSAADQHMLDAYLGHLSSARIDGAASREALLAFWINAYNAVTVKGILREYPTSSIKNHTSSFGGYNIWKNLLLPVDGQNYSLDKIEHEVLRKMGEPRIHFAIVCASVGCPRLLNQAYVPERLDAQLTENARAFFADRSKFSFDQARGTIQTSPILKWFGEDFGSNAAGQMRGIAPYLSDPAARQLAEGGTARVSYLDYDWSLNDQARLRNAARR